MKESFVHLHVHSHYSMMWGVSSVKVLCETATAAGFEYLALTDTNGFYGLINFLEAARQHGIRPIVGVHLQVGNESAVILAKTARGYELLSELNTRRHLSEDFSLARDFPDAPSHLAILSSDPDLIKSLRTKAECRVEAVPGPAGRRALEMANALGVPPVATNAVYFAHPDDYPLHRLVRAIDLNKTLSTLPHEEVVRPEQWLKSAPWMSNHFPNCEEALANTVALARECLTAWDHFRTVFPHYLDRQGDHFARLLEKCREGIRRRYGETSEVIEGRLSEELELIRSKGYVDYFLVVADIVGRRPIHCGRGSAAASLVSYLLGITHVDPIRHHLLFGRFLNPHRQDHPDIDVDFPWDERDDLLEELRQHYGSERLAMVSNHVGFGARASVREVAKVYGIPAADIKEVTRRMSFWTHPAGIWKRVKTHPKFLGFPLDPPWPEVIDLAGRLESLPRHLSVHCGGIVLVPDRVSRYVPVERSAKGAWVIQWEKDQAEHAGLVKIDLLGNRSLAVIRDALVSIERNTGKRLDYPSLNPLSDPATLELLKQGKTMGVFYVESPAMRQLQQMTQRGDFEHLVIHSSIIRPAANRYIQEYVKRLHGAPYQPLHPSLKEILAETYGILVYQEDVVQVAMALAGFNWAEADGLRKVLSKKSAEQLSSYRQRFFDGCAQRGISIELVNTVWDMFLSFAGYSFCKPHSASYALVSFKSAYLKVHHPAEFMAAVISNGGGYYSTLAYISEARRMGITVLGPDINESDWNYLGKDMTLRIGLQQLQGIRRDAVEAVLHERSRNGPFTSLEDLLRRVKSIHPADAAILVKSGSLDSLAVNFNRPQVLWFVESWLQRQFPAAIGQKVLPLALPPFHVKIMVPLLPDLTPQRKWIQEMDTLGFVLSVHPITLFEPSVGIHRHRIVNAADLARYIGHRVWVLGWPVTRKEVLTRKGEAMEFVSFEDETAIYETVFFPKAFRRFCQDLDMNRVYLICGRVESEFETVNLNVHQLYRIPTKSKIADGDNFRGYFN
jgi:DNA-directed DNA polymerase III PolC